MPDLRLQLEAILRGRACCVGVGNVACGDDGAGVRLAETLAESAVRILKFEEGRFPLIIVAGTAPERHLNQLTDGGFDAVVFLDAVDFHAAPGSVVLLDSSEMASRFPQVSTHRLSLGLLARLIEASNGARVWLLGIQPGSLRPETGLSPAVTVTVDILADLFSPGRIPAVARGGEADACGVLAPVVPPANTSPC